MKLLTRKNTKMLKQPPHAEFAWETAGLELTSPIFCPAATPACKRECIRDAGRGVMPVVQRARWMRTRWFRDDKDSFKEQLHHEVGLLKKRAHKKCRLPAVRLNVFSDIAWEDTFPELFTDYPDVVFYDYTKRFTRLVTCDKGWIRDNYYLTASWQEQLTHDAAKRLLKLTNLAVPFFGGIPESFCGFQVINGDTHDLRFLDKTPGRIVGLVHKGRAGSRPTEGREFGLRHSDFTLAGWKESISLEL